jgi:hypothetical protein
MHKLLRTLGNPVGQGLHVMHCPMPMSGSSADWSQVSAEVENRYYREQMNRCGSVLDRAEPAAYLRASAAIAVSAGRAS